MDLTERELEILWYALDTKVQVMSNKATTDWDMQRIEAVRALRTRISNEQTKRKIQRWNDEHSI